MQLDEESGGDGGRTVACEPTGVTSSASATDSPAGKGSH